MEVVCAICYEGRSRFFSLLCCRHNQICYCCLENLLVPRCPFCRETIQNYIPPKRPRVLEFSGGVPRTERRQVRRALKLELREQDRERSRRARSFSL